MGFVPESQTFWAWKGRGARKAGYSVQGLHRKLLVWSLGFRVLGFKKGLGSRITRCRNGLGEYCIFHRRFQGCKNLELDRPSKPRPYKP